MPATSRIHATRNEEFAVRERATATRLGQFRGGMCDLDFAQLVTHVLRVRDNGERRQSIRHDIPMDIVKI